MSLFTQADLDRLSGPHVARLWFLEVDMGPSIARFHNGIGRVEAGGHEWIGVTDPIGGQLVGVTAVQNPKFGQAAVITVTIAGANAEFFKRMRTEAASLEGRPARMLWAAYDPESETATIDLKAMFPGKISRPVVQREGVGTRLVTINIEDMWQAQNYPFGGRWSPADQKRRYPGDKGLDYVGVKVKEVFK